ncbi:MAG: hypothetical protein LAT68_17400 [Cyclobacteriaceae bacterium]|nr:hypothetical protein [Cyclobacteriaceae bacterium]
MKYFTTFFILLLFLSVSCRNDEWKNYNSYSYKSIESGVLIKSDSLFGIIFDHSYNMALDSTRDIFLKPIQLIPTSDKQAWAPDLAVIQRFERRWHKYWLQARNDSLAVLNNKLPILIRDFPGIGGRQYTGFTSSEGHNKLYVVVFGIDIEDNSWMYLKSEPTGIDPINYEMIYSVPLDSIIYIGKY